MIETNTSPRLISRYLRYWSAFVLSLLRLGSVLHQSLVPLSIYFYGMLSLVLSLCSYVFRTGPKIVNNYAQFVLQSSVDRVRHDVPSVFPCNSPLGGVY